MAELQRAGSLTLTEIHKLQNHLKQTVKWFFSFLVTEFGFTQTKEIENGNAFYNVEYKDTESVISISYKNIEDYLQVIIFKLRNGILPDYDDKSRTLHLNSLNKTIFSMVNKSEIEENDMKFEMFRTSNEVERKLLKSARELRLVLSCWNRYS